jgi:hypothetical protein
VRSKVCLSFDVEIKVQMPHHGGALFGAFATASAKRIDSRATTCARGVFVREPAEVTRRELTLKGSYSLEHCARRFAPNEKRNSLARRKGTG